MKQAGKYVRFVLQAETSMSTSINVCSRRKLWDSPVFIMHAHKARSKFRHISQGEERILTVSCLRKMPFVLSLSTAYAPATVNRQITVNQRSHYYPPIISYLDRRQHFILAGYLRSNPGLDSQERCQAFQAHLQANHSPRPSDPSQGSLSISYY